MKNVVNIEWKKSKIIYFQIDEWPAQTGNGSFKGITKNSCNGKVSNNKSEACEFGEKMRTDTGTISKKDSPVG